VVRNSDTLDVFNLYFMSTRIQKIISVLLPAVLMATLMQAQVASWNFNGTLAGTGAANSIAGNASLGSSIAMGAYNGGTLYYGEGNWPAGAIDLNAYLEFSVTPTAGHTVTISNMALQIRRSTTGTAAGSGPNNWSLRSSLDNYASDVASGVLTQNSAPATAVVLGVPFMNLPAKVIFRLYGYNATVSTGGLNRFVYDDFVLNGSTVLPVVFDYFNVKAVNQSADITWKLGGEGTLSAMYVERADHGNKFEVIRQMSADQLNTVSSFQLLDPLNNPDGTYAYRLRIISADGEMAYSPVQMISFNSETSFQLQSITASNTHAVQFRVNADKSGNYVFSLFNLNGNRVALKTIQLNTGHQLLQMDNAPLKSGIYVLVAENGSQTISTKVAVL